MIKFSHQKIQSSRAWSRRRGVQDESPSRVHTRFGSMCCSDRKMRSALDQPIFQGQIWEMMHWTYVIYKRGLCHIYPRQSLNCLLSISNCIHLISQWLPPWRPTQWLLPNRQMSLKPRSALMEKSSRVCAWNCKDASIEYYTDTNLESAQLLARIAALASVSPSAVSPMEQLKSIQSILEK